MLHALYCVSTISMCSMLQLGVLDLGACPQEIFEKQQSGEFENNRKAVKIIRPERIGRDSVNIRE